MSGAAMSAPVAAPVDVTTVLWRLSQGGGVQTVVRTLVGALDPERVRLRVVTARPRLAEDALDDVGVDVVGLGHTGSRLRPWRRLHLAWAVARDVRRERPSVVHLHSGTVWLGALARVLAPRRGWVVEVHDAPGSGRHGRLTDRVEGWFCRLGRATVVCHSTSVAAEVRRRWKVPVARIACFPLSVDLAQFTASPQRRAAGRAALGLPPDAVVILAVGRLVPSKRFDLAIEALAALSPRVAATDDDVRSPTLVVVGDGGERERLAAQAARLGVAARVLLPGARFGDDLGDAYAAADILVSTSDYEGFGLTLVEAMAAGLPVVATAVGGVTDIVVDGGTGHLVGVGDTAAVAARLGDLVTSPARRIEMGAAGRSRAEAEFTPQRLAAAFADVYERVARR